MWKIRFVVILVTRVIYYYPLSFVVVHCHRAWTIEHFKFLACLKQIRLTWLNWLCSFNWGIEIKQKFWESYLYTNCMGKTVKINWCKTNFKFFLNIFSVKMRTQHRKEKHGNDEQEYLCQSYEFFLTICTP